MTDPDFRALVDKMREAQREYFRTHSPQALRSAKDYEKRVDLALKGEQPGRLL